MSLIQNDAYFEALKERYDLLDDATASYCSLMEDKPWLYNEGGFEDEFPDCGVNYSDALNEIEAIEQIFKDQIFKDNNK